MNGTVVAGVAIVLGAVILNAPWLMAWLVAGVAVIAFGAFGPSAKRPGDPASSGTPPRPAEDERFV